MVVAFKQRLRNVSKSKWLLFMTLPGMMFLFIFNYIPMFGLLIAFKDYKYSQGILGSKWVGFDNFKFLFATEDVWRVTFNTLLLNGLFIICGLVFSVALALLMYEVKNRVLSMFYQSTYFLPYLLSWVLVGYFAYAMFTTEGFANQIMSWFGLESISWYTSPEYWPFILVLVSIWKTAGYTSIIYLAGMLGINTEYYEAAKLDGASKWQQVISITLPLLMPVITIMLLLQIGKIFYADFGLFYNVTRDSGMLYSTTDVIDTYVFRMLRKIGDFGMASAAGFYQAIVGFVLVFISNLIVRKVDKDSALF
ncbi:ABC transporter permease [Paenibacillus nasutitermitis]|uniref:Sugar ABC transporter permease n=1 Tax=Paenibacillus nasutitermitis TaxID=1652958 RepID=A0A916ZLM3_9BACL|nr:ABC transporter permease subunit [Paenibacillus nasutitermitis]GGE02496.1 sugar ABC transporter permease [Paenibacillus nasutitermitis]